MHLPIVPSSTGLSAPPPWPPLVAARGPGSRTATHAHHAMHLVLARSGALRVRAGAGPWHEAAGVLTAPDAPHALDASGTETLIVFLDPESELGGALRAGVAGALRLLSPAQRDALAGVEPAELMGPGGIAFGERLLEALGAGGLPARALHPRVRRVLRALAAMPPRGAVPVEELARTAGLSPGRLMHAFEESVGIPLRPYLLWLKLQRAGAAIFAGAPLSAAAHAAGFSDSAHMTRTFRRMLGGPPSAIRSVAQPRAARTEESRARPALADRQARTKAPPST